MSIPVKHINNVFYPSLLIGLGLGMLASCRMNTQQGYRQIAEALKRDTALLSDKVNESNFFVTATEISLEAITYGQLAQMNGLMEVRQLGKMMEEEHYKILGELTAMAKIKLITIPGVPGSESKLTPSNLAALKNELFDAAYCQRQTAELEKAIGEYESAVQNTDDLEIKAWSSRTLNQLHTEWEYLMECKLKFDRI